MWAGAATGRFASRLLSSRAPIRNPSLHNKPYLHPAGVSGGAPALLPASHLHNATVPWKIGLARPTPDGGRASGAAVPFSSAASAGEAPGVLGSLGTSAPLVSVKPRDVADVIRHYGRCYWELSKARLSMLVVATSGAGFVLGSGSSIDIAGLCCTCAGTMMVAASANTLNQVFEIKNDAMMKRTRQRPLPSGRLGVRHAAIWAASLGIAGTSLLALKANYLAAVLAASNLVLYAFVYTPLKQIHPANTWVGAIVGAIPPLLGWAAACGIVSLKAMILPAALYFWQLPHFMALAYLCRNDYIAGGFRMFSLADASGQRTALVSFRNCLYLLPVGLLAYDWGLTSEWFTLESSLLTISMTIASFLFVRDRTAKNARRMFHASLLYLPVFMAGLLFHRLPNREYEPMISGESGADVLLSEGQMHEDETNSTNSFQFVQTKNQNLQQKRPPVAYASVAPFPFLPAPIYVSSDS